MSIEYLVCCVLVSHIVPGEVRIFEQRLTHMHFNLKIFPGEGNPTNVKKGFNFHVAGVLN